MTPIRLVVVGMVGFLAVLPGSLAAPPTAAEASASTEITTQFEGPLGVVDDQPQPLWDRDAIRNCAHRYAGHPRFNWLFACFCLWAGAETEGEQVSADAQCLQATQSMLSGG